MLHACGVTLALALLTTTPISSLAQQRSSAAEKIVISGVQVNDFYKKNLGNYGDVISLSSGDNPIQFDKNRGVFQISILAITESDFTKNRNLVEQQLISILGITRVDACKLVVEETKNSPGGWDGRTDGLSFCSNQLARPSAVSSVDEWAAFWKNFRTAVMKRDRIALRQLMSSNVEWAGDGQVTAGEAITYIDQGIVSWRNMLRSVNGGVIACKSKDSSCWNFSGNLAKRTIKPNWLVFEVELGKDNRWRWVRVVGD